MLILGVGLLSDTSVIVLNQLLPLVLDNCSWRECGQEVFRPVELRLPWLLAIGQVREKEVRVWRLWEQEEGAISGEWAESEEMKVFVFLGEKVEGEVVGRLLLF